MIPTCHFFDNWCWWKQCTLVRSTFNFTILTKYMTDIYLTSYYSIDIDWFVVLLLALILVVWVDYVCEGLSVRHSDESWSSKHIIQSHGLLLNFLGLGWVDKLFSAKTNVTKWSLQLYHFFYLSCFDDVDVLLPLHSKPIISNMTD